MQFVNLNRQYQKHQQSIQQKISDVLSSGQYILGPQVEELENTLSHYVDSSHAIGVASGTDALLLSLMALDIRPGDEVITSSFTFVATGEVILRLGAIPIFVDIDPHSYNMNPILVEQAITPKTKVILAVSLFGEATYLTAINQVAQKHQLPVIEDGCQSFGALCSGSRSGSLTTLGCTSFYPSKPLGCYGDGGMIFTSSQPLAQKIKHLRVHGASTGNTQPGLNSRLDTIQAAILLAKWTSFEQELILRKKAAEFYIEELSHLEAVKTPSLSQLPTHSFAQFTIECLKRDQLQNYLKARGIPTGVYYRQPLHHQPLFLATKKQALPMTEEKSKRVLSLPLSPYITRKEQEDVIKSIGGFFS